MSQYFRKYASNGLRKVPLYCQNPACRRHLCNEAVVLGEVDKVCPACKLDNVFKIDRRHDQRYFEAYAEQERDVAAMEASSLK